MPWRDAADFSADRAKCECAVKLAAGRVLRYTFVGDLAASGSGCLPVVIGPRSPTRRGLSGPFWSAARLGRQLGPHVLIEDPTVYLDPVEARAWYAAPGGARRAISAVVASAGRLARRPVLVIGGGTSAAMAIDAAASCGGTALAWSPLLDPEASPAGARADGPRFAVPVDPQGEFDLCELPLPPRLLLVQNADDPMVAAGVGPFLDTHRMVSGEPGAYRSGDAHLVVFPSLGPGVTEPGDDVLVAVARALGDPSRTVREVHCGLLAEGVWGRLAAPEDLRDRADEFAAAAVLHVDWSGPVVATVGWRSRVPDGVRTDFVAYGRFGRLPTAPDHDRESAAWPAAARITHVVARLVDGCGHELGRLRAAAPAEAAVGGY